VTSGHVEHCVEALKMIVIRRSDKIIYNFVNYWPIFAILLLVKLLAILKTLGLIVKNSVTFQRRRKIHPASEY